MSKKRKNKNNKKCSPSRRVIWFLFSGASIAIRALAAFSLFVIAIKMHPLQNHARLFNGCVEESIENGKKPAFAIHFCSGGE